MFRFCAQMSCNGMNSTQQIKVIYMDECVVDVTVDDNFIVNVSGSQRRCADKVFYSNWFWGVIVRLTSGYRSEFVDCRVGVGKVSIFLFSIFEAISWL